jgi:hypothetical protein
LSGARAGKLDRKIDYIASGTFTPRALQQYIVRKRTMAATSPYFEHRNAHSGRAFVVDHLHGIIVLDADSGHIERIIERPGPQRLKGCNNLYSRAAAICIPPRRGKTRLQDVTGSVHPMNHNS